MKSTRLVGYLIVVILLWSSRSAQSDQCASRLTVAAVGDIIFHGALLRQSMHSNSGVPDFSGLWRLVDDHLTLPDILYGNLEGPSSPLLPYSADKAGASMQFNFHPKAIIQLKEAGFDVLGLANNHALDAGYVGADATLDLLNGQREDIGERAKIANFGLLRSDENSIESTVAIVTKKGFKFAFIGCTYGVNGYEEFHQRLIPCHQPGSHQPNRKLLKLISSYANSGDVGGVIFTPHWGIEYSRVSRAQTVLARAAVDAGALVVVGHHPHVLQTYEQYKGKYIFYSLGSFISNHFPQNRTYSKQVGETVYVRRHHDRLNRRLSAILFLDIERESVTAEKQEPIVADSNKAVTHFDSPRRVHGEHGSYRTKGFRVLPLYMKIGAPGYGAEGTAKLDQIYGESIVGRRTLVPLYIEKYTGQPQDSAQLKNLHFHQPLSQVTDRQIARTIQNGSYTLAQNMKLAHDLALELFPAETWLSHQQLEMSDALFDQCR